MLIADSTTMCSEAAVLGTPSVEFDTYFEEIPQIIELDKSYGLIKCFRPEEKKSFFNYIDSLLNESKKE